MKEYLGEGCGHNSGRVHAQVGTNVPSHCHACTFTHSISHHYVIRNVSK